MLESRIEKIWETQGMGQPSLQFDFEMLSHHFRPPKELEVDYVTNQTYLDTYLAKEPEVWKLREEMLDLVRDLKAAATKDKELFAELKPFLDKARTELGQAFDQYIHLMIVLERLRRWESEIPQEIEFYQKFLKHRDPYQVNLAKEEIETLRSLLNNLPDFYQEVQQASRNVLASIVEAMRLYILFLTDMKSRYHV